MPRYARKMSSTDIYHIMLRGNERKNIFQNRDDKARLIDTILEKRNKIKFNIFAYCIMDNHMHLLIKQGEEPISETMRRIGTSYAVYYNLKHDRVGHVFQNRYKSESIESDAHLLDAIRYIHNNPVKANMVNHVAEYDWSSYLIYINEDRYTGIELFDGINNDIEFILGMFSNKKDRAVEFFKDFTSQETQEEYIDIERIDRSKNIISMANEILKNYNIGIDEIKQNKEIRNIVIKHLKEKHKVSGRAIARALGINRNVVQRIK